MNIADLTNPATNPLPEEVQSLVAALIEGRVHSLAILAETTGTDGEPDWIAGFSLDMDDNETDEVSFVGAVALLQKAIHEAIDPPSVNIIQIKPSDDDPDAG